MKSIVLDTLLAYFKKEIKNNVTLKENEITIYFLNGKKAKVKIEYN